MAMPSVDHAGPGRPGPSAPTAPPRFGSDATYYGYVARGYDTMAATYDGVEGRNAISERVRAATLRAALDVLRPGQRVLELGCGTGRDAVALAGRGLRVVATDVSERMVQVTRERADAAGLGELVRTVHCSAAQAAHLPERFEGVYSNGAVLNLEPDLAGMADGLRECLVPGGFAILTAANRLSLFELGLYPLVLRPRKAFRRLGSSVPIPISREGFGRRYVVPTRFLTPREFRRHLGEGFEVNSLRGLELVTPPWNLVDMAERFRPAVVPLEHLEDRIGTWPGLRDLGAIYLYVLRRTSR